MHDARWSHIDYNINDCRISYLKKAIFFIHHHHQKKKNFTQYFTILFIFLYGAKYTFLLYIIWDLAPFTLKSITLKNMLFKKNSFYITIIRDRFTCI